MAKKKVSRKKFDKEMKRLQTELCALQDWVVAKEYAGHLKKHKDWDA